MAPSNTDWDGNNCRYCGRKTTGFKNKQDHLKACSKAQTAFSTAAQAKVTKTTEKKKKSARVSKVQERINTHDQASDQASDQDLNHEQSQLKGYRLQEINDATAALERTGDAPRTAAFMIQKLLKGPKQHIIKFKVMERTGKNTKKTSTYLRFGTDVSVAKYRNAGDNRTQEMYALEVKVDDMSTEDARSLAKDGFCPILERFVSPPQAMKATGWLLNAAKRLCLAKNPALRLQYVSPSINQDPTGTRPKFIPVTISGHDVTADKPYWELTFQIRQGHVLPKAPITFSLEDRIEWTPGTAKKGPQKKLADGQTLEEHQQALWPGYETSREYLLAKKMLVMFDGYLGKREDANLLARTAKARYTGKETQQIKYLNISLGDAGDLIIAPAASIDQELRSSVTPISINTNHYLVMVEILTPMLDVEDAGGNLEAQFDAGAQAADVQRLFQEEDPDFCPRVEFVCDATPDELHSHICHSCLLGRPCSDFRDRDTSGMLCFTCLSTNKSAGWALKQLKKKGNKTPTISSFPATSSQFVRNIRFYMLEEFAKHDAHKDLESMSQEIASTTTDVTKDFQASQPTQWYDYIIKQAVYERGERYINWKLARINPFFPSVDAVHPIYFLNETSRYHAHGNMAPLSWSANLMKGPNSSLVIKAAFQQLTANTLEEYLDGVVLAQRCLILRNELHWNSRFKRVGTKQSAYYQHLEASSHTGELPSERHVPKETLFKTDPGRGSDSRPKYRMPGYDEYLKPAAEKVAARYGFEKEGRELWQRAEALCGGEKVLWTFSNTLSHRIVSRDQCNNHTKGLYKDDPSGRRVPNLERYMLMVLHIHLNLLEKSRKRRPRWENQPLQALDVGGLEYVPNVLTPWALSIAHAKHGEHMDTGWVDEDDEHPIEQGEESFSFDKLNCDLQTWMVNAGLYTADVADQARVNAIFNQLRNVRIEEADFVTPGARPYIAGRFTYDYKQHLEDINADVFQDDDNFTMKVVREQLAPVPGADGRSRRRSSPAKKKERSRSIRVIGSSSSSEGQPGDFEAPEDPPAHPYRQGSSSSQFPFFSDPHGVVAIRQPQSSNLGRGRATCYVSSAIQTLYRNSRLRETISRSQIVASHDVHLVRTDPGMKNHAQFLLSLKVLLLQLRLQDPSSQQVPARYVTTFREACTTLTRSTSTPDGIWPDEECDTGEFVDFILTTLNIATDKSGVVDRSDNILTSLEATRLAQLQEEEMLPRLREDIEEFDQSRRLSGFDSSIDPVHTAHVVEQRKCDHRNRNCGAVATTHIYPGMIVLPMPPGSQDDEDVEFSDLRDLYLSRAQTTLRGCPACFREDLNAGESTLRHPLHRIVNAPEVLMFQVSRFHDGRVNLARVNWPHELDLKDWRPQLHRDSETYKPESDEYQLQSIMFYQHQPKHYFVYIREGKDFVMYDDTKTRPTFESPFMESRPTCCESVFVYVKKSTSLLTVEAASSAQEKEGPNSGGGIFISSDKIDPNSLAGVVLTMDAPPRRAPSEEGEILSHGAQAALDEGILPPASSKVLSDILMVGSDLPSFFDAKDDIPNVSDAAATSEPAERIQAPYPTLAELFLSSRPAQNDPYDSDIDPVGRRKPAGAHFGQGLVEIAELLGDQTPADVKDELTQMRKIFSMNSSTFLKSLLDKTRLRADTLREAGRIFNDAADAMECGGSDERIIVPSQAKRSLFQRMPDLGLTPRYDEQAGGASPVKRSRLDAGLSDDEEEGGKSPRKIAKLSGIAAIKNPFGAVSSDSDVNKDVELPAAARPPSPEERASDRKVLREAERAAGFIGEQSPSRGRGPNRSPDRPSISPISENEDLSEEDALAEDL